MVSYSSTQSGLSPCGSMDDMYESLSVSKCVEKKKGGNAFLKGEITRNRLFNYDFTGRFKTLPKYFITFFFQKRL